MTGRAWSLVLLTFLAGPVSAADKPGKGESDEAALARVRGQIMALIGEARCRNLVHCRLLPLGLDNCGKPVEYLAYSSGMSDVTALETRASEYAFLWDEMQSRKTPSGGCTDAPEPLAVCIDNHCRVRPAGK